MSAPHAIVQATFSNVKSMPSRKIVQLVLEIPIEQADNAIAALGGFPRSDCERWVAIALLDTDTLSHNEGTEI